MRWLKLWRGEWSDSRVKTSGMKIGQPICVIVVVMGIQKLRHNQDRSGPWKRTSTFEAEMVMLATVYALITFSHDHAIIAMVGWPLHEVDSCINSRGDFHICDPLVTKHSLAIENDHLQWIFPLKIVIFHSYICYITKGYPFWVTHQHVGLISDPEAICIRQSARSTLEFHAPIARSLGYDLLDSNSEVPGWTNSWRPRARHILPSGISTNHHFEWEIHYTQPFPLAMLNYYELLEGTCGVVLDIQNSTTHIWILYYSCLYHLCMKKMGLVLLLFY